MGTFPDCDVKLCDLEISRVIVAGQEVRELLGTPDYVCKRLNLFVYLNAVRFDQTTEFNDRSFLFS